MPRRVLCAVALVAAVAAARADDPVVARMKKDIFYLAGPECDGRGTGTDGNQKAGEYVAAAFKDAGLQPAMPDGAFFQPFLVAPSPTVGKPTSVRLTGPNDQSVDLRLGSEFSPYDSSASKAASGDLVFVGYGISSESLKYDDYAGVDVAGKTVVLFRRTPRADNKDKPFDPDPNSQYGTFAAKIETAVKKKAAAIIFVNDRTYATNEDKVVTDTLRAFAARRYDAVSVPVVQMKRSALEHMLAYQDKSLTSIEQSIDKDLVPRSVVLTGWRAKVQVTITTQGTPARNVVGVLPGSGPLADETVVIGAHYDHVGNGMFGSLGGTAARGKVHYGADDNASGTTALIELARRYGAMKGRIGRRLVFIAFSGEELGLLGSVHYCKEPIFPLDKTVFMLNMDMVGRSVEMEVDGKKKDRLVIYGHGTGEGFEKLVDDANKKYDFRLFKVEGGNGPSDHDSFYRKDIPVLFFFTGTHPDYHRPGDTPDKINLPVMKKVADMADGFVSHFAQVTDRPKFQKTKGGWSDPTEEKGPRPASPRAAMPTLGFAPGDYSGSEKGVLIGSVSPGKAAEKAGLLANDLIIDLAGKPVADIEEYMKVLMTLKPGVEIEVGIKRKGEKKTLKVTPMAAEKKD